jgi:hypothetical protein
MAIAWTKKAEVTPGEKNTEIKPGTTDEKIGQEFKESEEHKALGAPEGDQKEPSTGVKENPEVHKDEKHPTPPGPKGDQKDIKMDTHTEKPMDVKEENPGKITEKDASTKINWLKKKADVTPGTENKDIKPGTVDETIGYDYKEKDGESAKVLGAPEGDQAQVAQDTHEDPGAAEFMGKPENQQLTNAPKGDQKPIPEKTHTEDGLGSEYKEEGVTELPPANASLTKSAAWLKKPIESDLKLPEKYATFDKIADDYSTLYGFYANALGEEPEADLFGRAVASLTLREADMMTKQIERMINTLHSSIQRSAATRKDAWLSVSGGLMKQEGGMTIVAKTKEEAKKLDSCVEAKMSDPKFKPRPGRTKKQSAYAICSSSVLGKSSSLEEGKDGTTEKTASQTSSAPTIESDKEDALLVPIIASMDERLKTDHKFAEAMQNKDKKTVVAEFLKKIEAARKHKIDFIKLAHYSIDCPTCFDAVLSSLNRGLVPTDFKAK